MSSMVRIALFDRQSRHADLHIHVDVAGSRQNFNADSASTFVQDQFARPWRGILVCLLIKKVSTTVSSSVEAKIKTAKAERQ